VVAGARAPLASGRPQRALTLLASSSTLWPDTLGVMGWNVSSEGLHVVFSRDIPAIVRQRVRPGVVEFLARESLTLEDVRHLVAHPGGAKVLAAYAEALGRPRESFAHAYDVLARYGNMSSPTCLFVLERFLDSGTIGAADYALVSALGPGFSAEYVLAQGVA
jgi:alkylresorcinol/alkylpyrone synthase